MTEAGQGFGELLVETFVSTVGDVLPIAAILVGAQVFVLRRKVPHLPQLLAGFVMVLFGLAFFLIGLDLALFELGEKMAEQLTAPAFLALDPAASASGADWTEYLWVYVFAAAIGFSTTIAEPSLIAVAIKANQVSAGAIGTWGLRVAVAVGVAVGISLINCTMRSCQTSISFCSTSPTITGLQVAPTAPWSMAYSNSSMAQESFHNTELLVWTI